MPICFHTHDSIQSIHEPNRIPRVGYVPYINKKDVGFFTHLSHSLAFTLPSIEDKQRISPRRAVYKRPLPIATRPWAGCNKRPKWTLPLPYLPDCSKLWSLTVEDNVRKRPFSKCLDPPPTTWADESVQNYSLFLNNLQMVRKKLWKQLKIREQSNWNESLSQYTNAPATTGYVTYEKLLSQVIKVHIWGGSGKSHIAPARKLSRPSSQKQ